MLIQKKKKINLISNYIYKVINIWKEKIHNYIWKNKVKTINKLLILINLI